MSENATNPFATHTLDDEDEETHVEVEVSLPEYRPTPADTETNTAEDETFSLAPKVITHDTVDDTDSTSFRCADSEETPSARKRGKMPAQPYRPTTTAVAAFTPDKLKGVGVPLRLDKAFGMLVMHTISPAMDGQPVAVARGLLRSYDEFLTQYRVLRDSEGSLMNPDDEEEYIEDKRDRASHGVALTPSPSERHIRDITPEANELYVPGTVMVTFIVPIREVFPTLSAADLQTLLLTNLTSGLENKQISDIIGQYDKNLSRKYKYANALEIKASFASFVQSPDNTKLAEMARHLNYSGRQQVTWTRQHLQKVLGSAEKVDELMSGLGETQDAVEMGQLLKDIVDRSEHLCNPKLPMNKEKIAAADKALEASLPEGFLFKMKLYTLPPEALEDGRSFVKASPYNYHPNFMNVPLDLGHLMTLARAASEEPNPRKRTLMTQRIVEVASRSTWGSLSSMHMVNRMKDVFERVSQRIRAPQSYKGASNEFDRRFFRFYCHMTPNPAIVQILNKTRYHLWLDTLLATAHRDPALRPFIEGMNLVNMKSSCGAPFKNQKRDDAGNWDIIKKIMELTHQAMVSHTEVYGHAFGSKYKPTTAAIAIGNAKKFVRDNLADSKDRAFDVPPGFGCVQVKNKNEKIYLAGKSRTVGRFSVGPLGYENYTAAELMNNTIQKVRAYFVFPAATTNLALLFQAAYKSSAAFDEEYLETIGGDPNKATELIISLAGFNPGNGQSAIVNDLITNTGAAHQEFPFRLAPYSDNNGITQRNPAEFTVAARKIVIGDQLRCQQLDRAALLKAQLNDEQFKIPAGVMTYVSLDVSKMETTHNAQTSFGLYQAFIQYFGYAEHAARAIMLNLLGHENFSIGFYKNLRFRLGFLPSGSPGTFLANHRAMCIFTEEIIKEARSRGGNMSIPIPTVLSMAADKGWTLKVERVTLLNDFGHPEPTTSYGEESPTPLSTDVLGHGCVVTPAFLGEDASGVEPFQLPILDPRMSLPDFYDLVDKSPLDPLCQLYEASLAEEDRMMKALVASPWRKTKDAVSGSPRALLRAYAKSVSLYVSGGWAVPLVTSVKENLYLQIMELSEEHYEALMKEFDLAEKDKGQNELADSLKNEFLLTTDVMDMIRLRKDFTRDRVMDLYLPSIATAIPPVDHSLTAVESQEVSQAEDVLLETNQFLPQEQQITLKEMFRTDPEFLLAAVHPHRIRHVNPESVGLTHARVRAYLGRGVLENDDFQGPRFLDGKIQFKLNPAIMDNLVQIAFNTPTTGMSNNQLQKFRSRVHKMILLLGINQVPGMLPPEILTRFSEALVLYQEKQIEDFRALEAENEKRLAAEMKAKGKAKALVDELTVFTKEERAAHQHEKKMAKAERVAKSKKSVLQGGDFAMKPKAKAKGGGKATKIPSGPQTKRAVADRVVIESGTADLSSTIFDMLVDYKKHNPEYFTNEGVAHGSLEDLPSFKVVAGELTIDSADEREVRSARPGFKNPDIKKFEVFSVSQGTGKKRKIRQGWLAINIPRGDRGKVTKALQDRYKRMVASGRPYVLSLMSEGQFLYEKDAPLRRAVLVYSNLLYHFRLLPVRTASEKLDNIFSSLHIQNANGTISLEDCLKRNIPFTYKKKKKPEKAK